MQDKISNETNNHLTQTVVSKDKLEYRLVRQVLSSQTFVPISKNEYQDILVAKEGLMESLYLEEKFDIVLENFYEYEVELLRLSTHQMLFSNLSYSKFHNEINLINRRIVNLLSACRLYIDHSSHHLSNIFNGDKSKKSEIKSNISNEYDTVLGYRVMEALRNYVQHRGFPVQRCTYNSKRVEGEGQDKLLFSITPHIDTEILNEDGKFKKSVLDELQKSGEVHDIKPLLREYIASISSIHEKNRTLLKDLVNDWEKLFNSKIEIFRQKAGKDESIIGLAAVAYEDNIRYISAVPIFLDPIEHRKELEKKNGNLASLVSRYVSSEVSK